MGRATWSTVPITTRDTDEPLFFDEHQWSTIEAATARIIPTDHHPGAREAEVVRFIDRYLSGIEYIYAAAKGDGFVKMEGRDAEAWRQRIADRQAVYVNGIKELDELSNERFGAPFVDLDEDQQDRVLEELSGEDKPPPFRLRALASGLGDAPPANAPVQGPGSDEGLDFFSALVMHTRQGFYADPVYGGNKDRIGWAVIGFDGPRSLADTTDGTYTTIQYMIPDAEWPYEQHPATLRQRWAGTRGSSQ